MLSAKFKIKHTHMYVFADLCMKASSVEHTLPACII